MTPKIVDYVPSAEEEEKTHQKIQVLVGAVFLIQSVEIKKTKSRESGNEYEYALLQTNVGEFRTSIGALVTQLHEMEPQLKAGSQMRVKLTIRDGKYRFVAP